MFFFFLNYKLFILGNKYIEPEKISVEKEKDLFSAFYPMSQYKTHSY